MYEYDVCTMVEFTECHAVVYKIQNTSCIIFVEMHMLEFQMNVLERERESERAKERID